MGIINSVYAQDIHGTLDKAREYHGVHFQEKIYLHLDKPSYTAGDTIWIKAYCTVGVENLLSNLSGLAYIELIDPAEEVVYRMKIPLVMGLGLADIALQDTITEGSYRLRAYTNWMRNAGEEFFYDRTLSISNGRSDRVLTNTSIKQDTKGQVYTINLRELNGDPVGDIPVQFEILDKGKVVERKRGRADGGGVVSLTLDRRHGNAMVRYRFETADGRTVQKFVKATDTTTSYSVQLLPEGGKLLADRTNRIAVKAVDAGGLGIAAEVLFLSGADTVTRVQTNVLGMGATTLFPLSGSPLRAVAKFEDGMSQEIAVPTVHVSGYSLMLDNLREGRLTAELNLSDDLVDGREFYFVVHHLGRAYLASREQMKGQQVVFSAGTADLPNGVLTLSVLDNRLMPIAERPFFHYDTSEETPITITLDRESYSTREKVAVEIGARNEADSLLIGAFSASVLHLGKVDRDELEEAPNILSTLLLSSDLKGFIEKPGFYFANGNIKRQDLDYLMLTQGWRNIDWTSLDTVGIPPYRAEKGIRIAGHTKKLGRKTPEAGAIVQLFPTSSLLEYQETTADQNGYFEFGDLLFPDSMSFVLSARDTKGEDRIDITVVEEDLPGIGPNRNIPLERSDVNALQVNQIKASNARLAELRRAGLAEGTIMIDEVQVNHRQNRVSNRSKNPYGAGNADYIFTAEDFQGHTHLGQYMMDQIGSVLRWDPETGWPMGGIGVYVLDGMSIDSIRVQSIPIDAIESVEVLANGFYGVDPKKIIFYITTKPGNEAFNRISMPRGKTSIRPGGLYVAKTFYKPIYGATAYPTAVKDLRPTIHWEPSLVINKGKHIHFDFYVSDEWGKHCIVLEGVDVQGGIWRQLSEFKVLSRESAGHTSP
ncbi:hypothetical protein H8B06_08550 [Sphingobacterium sp. DN00404]|uniref:TonB-dependent receptor n=1 Tax=Sphingobacterium micropteri TaxID=2763501 RepID=A0ABR7YNR8_9SPHI|nr:hypothetical protein [Sphingobacterium micropteri]MBD1432871.1 hypothetical protein [Sphingobacterium micropteri]